MRITLYIYLCLVCYVTTFSKAQSRDAFYRKGRCPNTDGIVTICLFDPTRNCLRNDQCPYGYKCCSYGCGKECLAVTTGPRHPGSCAGSSSGKGSTCNRDRQCNTHEKCCKRHCVVVRPSSVPVIKK